MSRYPLQDLLDAAGLSGLPVTDQARRLGVERTQVYRWRSTGLTFEQAETAAERLGFVPYELWPAWLGESAERARESVERFMAAQREAAARWRRRHPERAKQVALSYRHRHLEKVRERDRLAVARKRVEQAKARYAS